MSLIKVLAVYSNVSIYRHKNHKWAFWKVYQFMSNRVKQVCVCVCVCVCVWRIKGRMKEESRDT